MDLVRKDGVNNIPDSKVHGANMGPIWGRQDPGGPHVGPMNFAIWDHLMNDNIHMIIWTLENIIVRYDILEIPENVSQPTDFEIAVFGLVSCLKTYFPAHLIAMIGFTPNVTCFL